MHNFDEEIRKARKIHFCTWCSNKISIGEEYLRWKTVDDSWFTNKIHKGCEFDLSEYCKENGGEYTPYSD